MFADSGRRDVHEEHDSAAEEPQEPGAGRVLHEAVALLQDE